MKVIITFKSLTIKIMSRLFIPNSRLAEIVELEAKRKLGKAGGSESIEHEVKTAVDFLKKTVFEKPFLVFDVGANMGNYSIELMKLFPECKIVAIEPSSEAFRQLTKRFEMNPNVKVVNYALGAVEGAASLFFDKAGSGLASLSQRNLDHINMSLTNSETITVSTGQALVEETGNCPTFVKIDVEGHELDVLRGFGEYLNSIKLIQFEFGGCNIDTRTFFKDFWALLSPNFKIFRISPNGPQLISKYSESHESFMTSNFLAVNKGS